MMAGVFLSLLAVMVASASQILLKKAAMLDFGSVIKEYLNWRVIVAYLFFGSTLILNAIASRVLPLTIMTTIDALGYVFVTLFSFLFLAERINKRKMIGIGLIIAGVLMFGLL